MHLCSKEGNEKQKFREVVISGGEGKEWDGKKHIEERSYICITYSYKL